MHELLELKVTNSVTVTEKTLCEVCHQRLTIYPIVYFLQKDIVYH
jgi:hypothetical protein